jgi:hypothetical protein
MLDIYDTLKGNFLESNVQLVAYNSFKIYSGESVLILPEEIQEEMIIPDPLVFYSNGTHLYYD